MNLKEIIEGKTKLLVPSNGTTKKSPVFFNPVMELSRDISVSVSKILLKKGNIFCDALAGCGARGIRIANELQYGVWINDINPKAFELIKKNVKLNSLRGIKITNLDANLLLSKEKFFWVDIDPFGSPVRFTDSAFRSVENKGIVAITATDTAPLSGTYINSCQRKYGAVPLKTDYYNELALRVLIGFFAREAGKYEKAFDILFSYCRKHYHRVYLKIKKSRSATNKMMKKIGFIQHCFSCLNREFKAINELEENCKCGKKFQNAGLLWTENFADKEFCNKLEKVLRKEEFRFMNEEIGIANKIKFEQGVNSPYYNIHKVFKRLKVEPKSMDIVIEKLKKNGFKAFRTHFSDLGIRTDAKVFDLYNLLKD